MGLLNGSESFGVNNSWNSGFNVSNAFSDNSGFSNSYSHTAGNAATAQAIINAQNANELSYQMWKAAAEYNSEEARINRAWQEYMSNTQYQRAIKDMIKSGVNPILAASNGLSSASIGSGATATMSQPQVFMGQTFAEQNSASTSSSTGHSESNGYGESQGEGHGWSESSSGLATALIQMGELIKEAINSKNTAERVQEGIKEVGNTVKEKMDYLTDWLTPYGKEEINKSTKQIENLDEYLNYRERHKSSGGGHKF